MSSQIQFLNDWEERYPRLQINKLGEIILATAKNNNLTTGILIAKTTDSKSKLKIGMKFDDWEVCGPLEDYNYRITVQFENQIKSN